VAEYNIKPWEMERLTTKDLQLIGLAEHADAYRKQELQRQHNMNSSHGQRSHTQSKKYKEWKQRMAN
jgi:hypothetical protein